MIKTNTLIETNKRTHFKDLTGKTYGRLTVIGIDGYNEISREYYWECKCTCGNFKTIKGGSLKTGATSSCGCLQKEQVYVHGMTKSKIYKTYRAMLDRCSNSKNSRYKDYGGRGIEVCSDWKIKRKGFLNFYNWAMSNGYNENLSLERINTDGNYEPLNCTWETLLQQNRNKRNTVWVDYNGEKITLGQLSEITGIYRNLLYSRIVTNKWSVEEALTLNTEKYK